VSESSQTEKKNPMPTSDVANEPTTVARLSDWMFQLLLSSVVLGAALAFYLSGPPAMILVLAASALSGAIWLMWSSLQRVGESDEMGFEEALSFAAPSATEEQKRAVLRALKDLEYERHVGKISEEDFIQVSAEYRQKAKELIAEQDEKMAAQVAAAEKRVATYLKKKEVKE
jgi:hypothetical protein